MIVEYSCSSDSRLRCVNLSHYFSFSLSLFFDIPLRLLRLLRNLSDGSPNFTASAASAVNFLAFMK